MSGLKPAKQARLIGQTQVLPRSETKPTLLPPPSSAQQEGKDLHTTTEGSVQEASTRKTAPRHPKGHRVQNLSEVWQTMDSQQFLRCTDSYSLEDVWVQPISVEPTSSPYATVRMFQMVLGPHIKTRIVCSKMAISDLLKMLYLNQRVQLHMLGYDSKDFNQWLAEKTGEFIKAHGVAEANNGAMLCNYILGEDEEYTFYPSFLKYTTAVFRKISYHSYKNGEEGEKVVNPAMMKCTAVRGKFEYIWEVKFIPLPASFALDPDGEVSTEVPSTQPLDLH